MGKRTVPVAALLLFVIAVIPSFAEQLTPVEKGKAHFNNPTFAGGRKSCSECHSDGKYLKDAGMKTTFHIGGGEQNSLEDAINVCIVNANKGHAIDVNSDEMEELVLYIKSLGGQKEPADTK